jgi:hypothetical protein
MGGSEHQTVIDAQSRQAQSEIPDEELPVYEQADSDEELRKPKGGKITGLEVIVTKDGGERAPSDSQ